MLVLEVVECTFQCVGAGGCIADAAAVDSMQRVLECLGRTVAVPATVCSL